MGAEKQWIIWTVSQLRNITKVISDCITTRKESKSVDKWTKPFDLPMFSRGMGEIDFFLFAEHVLTERINHVYLTKVLPRAVPIYSFFVNFVY